MMSRLKQLYFRLVLSEIAIFSSIGSDLKGVQHLLKGKVLNVGAGSRDVSHLIDGGLVNQNLTWPGDTRIHIHSPLHHIPVGDDDFDTILRISVLEYVENPEQAMQEMLRVLKLGGYLVLEVPFLQPEHKPPTDFQRYTKDGLARLASYRGFRVLEVKDIFTVYHTIYWQVQLWMHLKSSHLFLRARLLVPRLLLRGLTLPAI